MKFAQLGLSEPILRAVAAEGYAAPTPIQSQAIPHILAGHDLLGCAQTGTGKTAAFALPILDRLAAGAVAPLAHNGHASGKTRQASARKVRSLILCPTRELASQIGESFRAYGANTRLKHAVIFGGVNQFHQVRALQTGVDILVATPGRLLDLMQQGHVDLSRIEVFVLDEADRMLDMGFIPDVRRIVKQIPAKRQTLLFSATMPDDIRALADSILRNPARVQVAPVSSTVETIAQRVYFVQRQGKAALLAHLLKAGDMPRTLVFTRTKHGADKVVKTLTRCGIRAEAIHGNKSQNARTRALDQFKSKTPPVLVATDIASRGIDVDNVTHVVNFDLPDVPETYVHRIGRTARAGASGIALTFCDHEERGDFKAIERLTRASISPLPVPALEGVIPASDEGKAPRTPVHVAREGASRRHGTRSNRAPARTPAHPGRAHSHAEHAHRDASAHGRQRGFLARGRGKSRGR